MPAPAGPVQLNRSRYGRSTPSISTVRPHCGEEWSWGIAPRGWTGIRITSYRSKNSRHRSRICMRRSLSDSQSRWRAAVARLTNPSGVSSVLPAMCSIFVAGVLRRERREQQPLEHGVDLLEREAGPRLGVDAVHRPTRSPPTVSASTRRVEVSTGQWASSSQAAIRRPASVSPAPAAARAATPVSSTGRARRARRARARGRRSTAPSAR